MLICRRYAAIAYAMRRLCVTACYALLLRCYDTDAMMLRCYALICAPCHAMPRLRRRARHARLFMRSMQSAKQACMLRRAFERRALARVLLPRGAMRVYATLRARGCQLLLRYDKR